MPLEDSSDDDLLTSSDEKIILNRRKTHEKIRGYVNNVAPFQFFPRFALTLTVSPEFSTLKSFTILRQLAQFDSLNTQNLA
jgi:hypothetical protein